MNKINLVNLILSNLSLLGMAQQETAEERPETEKIEQPFCVVKAFGIRLPPGKTEFSKERIVIVCHRNGTYFGYLKRMAYIYEDRLHFIEEPLCDVKELGIRLPHGKAAFFEGLGVGLLRSRAAFSKDQQEVIICHRDGTYSVETYHLCSAQLPIVPINETI